MRVNVWAKSAKCAKTAGRMAALFYTRFTRGAILRVQLHDLLGAICRRRYIRFPSAAPFSGSMAGNLATSAFERAGSRRVDSRVPAQDLPPGRQGGEAGENRGDAEGNARSRDATARAPGATANAGSHA